MAQLMCYCVLLFFSKFVTFFWGLLLFGTVGIPCSVVCCESFIPLASKFKKSEMSVKQILLSNEQAAAKRIYDQDVCYDIQCDINV
jgi:hypothetical protein